MTTIGSPSTQSFDTLATSGTANTWTDNTTLVGWYSQFAATANPTTYRADAGGSNTGAIYSWGTGTATERALGSVGSGGTADIFNAVRLVNNTGVTITSLLVAFNGEQWRAGGCTPTPCTPAAQKIDFQYQVANAGVITDANTPTTGWTDHNPLDFTSPTPGTSTAAALDGNAAANRTALSATVTVTVLAGQEIWLRWFDTNDANNDHGLGIDDLSVTPNGVAQPNLTINDVSLNEGNAGTTNFTFTVSLSAPAGAGGVTFNIATADGTAQDDNPVTEDNDYQLKSLTAQTIPAGSSTYAFTVLVNGDTAPETNETFFVNVSSVTNATTLDSQGQGTIVNDDAAPNLTINDVSLNEGNAGTTTFTFTVSLSAPAGAGGVTFDIATADGTAQDDNPVTEDNDYVAKSLTAQSIPAGSSTYTFDVLVNGDLVPEGNETFFVNVTNVVNAIPADGQGQGTIVNDDLHKIHDIQGNGAATPIPATSVTIEGIVVGDYQGAAQLQGFFLEEENVDFDADPATSEGVFVFCGSCTTAVAEGQRVRATGLVSEFFGMTEVTASSVGSVVVVSAGNHLAEVTAAPLDLPVVGDVNTYYEAREGMLVTFIDTLSVSEYFELPRYGTIELFEGGRPRQFTEASPPSVAGNTAHLDNLNRRRVILDDDDDGQNVPLTLPEGSQFVFHPQANGGFSVGTQGTDFFRGGDLATGLRGVLHWSFSGVSGTDAWRLRPTTAAPATFTATNLRPATPPVVGGAIKAASVNLLNYFTTIDTTSSSTSGPCGPAADQDCRGADSVAELTRQRERTSIVLCALNAHVFGFGELENTTATGTINDLLGAVNARCGGANPYAFVNTGSTLGTDAIRVALIYRSATLSPVGSPLVDLDPIHNRPPTAQTFDVIEAANPAFGQRFTVIPNHFKSKGCDASAVGADADTSDGQGCYNGRRTAQATRLLTWITSTVLPAAGDPDVLLLGDFNSYAQENPVTTLAAGGFTDLETAFLGANAYSYLFDGQLGHLDYAFASSSLLPRVTGIESWHINADEVPLLDYNDEVKDTGEAAFEEKPDGSALVPPRVMFQPATPFRASDHDPVIVGLFQVADLSVTKVDTPDPVTAGSNLTYTITVANAGPDPAATVALSDTLPAGTTFVSLPQPAGWTCTTPAVGSGGTVSCSNPSLAVGSTVFTLTVQVGAGTAAGTVLSNTATVTSATGDPTPADHSATATTTVGASADLSVTKVDTPDPVTAGTNLTYTITVTNAGPSNAASASLSDTLPAGTTFVSLPQPAGWSCTTPAVGSGGTVSCTNPSLAAGSAVFTLTVQVAAGTAGGTVLSNTATVSSATTDPSPGNNSATATTTVGASADLSVTKVDTPDPVTAGTNLTYTITATNVGPSNAASAGLSDTLPAGTTFVALVPAAGWSCTTPAVGSGGTVSCTNPSFAAGSAVFTLTVQVAAGTAGGTVLSNTATVSSSTTDGNPGNNSATATTTVGALADLSITKTDSPDPVTAGTNLTYTITVTNAGPSSASTVSLSDTLPASTTFVSLASPAGWSCTTPAVGSGGTVTCANPSFAAGSAVFTLVVQVDVGTAGGTVLSNTATVTSATSEPGTGGSSNSATTTTTVTAANAVSATKTASGGSGPNTTVLYTVVLSNPGPNAQGDNPGDEFTDVLPTDLTLTGATATSGTVATDGNTVTWNGAIPVGGSVTIEIEALVNPEVQPGTVISNQGTVAYDADGNGTNESSAPTDDPAVPGGGDPTTIVVGVAGTIDIPTLDSLGLVLLAMVLAALGLAVLRRRKAA